MKYELRKVFLEKYPKYEIILRMYDEANGCECTFESLSKIRLQKFIDYMSGRVAKSSARQYAAKFKAVLNLYSEEFHIPNDYIKILNLRNEKCVSIWLNDGELERLSGYKAKSGNERLVQAQFLIGSYSGMRRSDYSRITEENMMDGFLSYVSQKTKIQATVPLKPIVAELIERVVISREISEMAFNEIIRNICKECGINERVKVFKAGKEVTGEKWMFVTSHTARRSFATNLYLRGADLYSISRMMGHSSVTMTEGYVVCGLREQSKEVLEYFK